MTLCQGVAVGATKNLTPTDFYPCSDHLSTGFSLVEEVLHQIVARYPQITRLFISPSTDVTVPRDSMHRIRAQ